MAACQTRVFVSINNQASMYSDNKTYMKKFLSQDLKVDLVGWLHASIVFRKLNNLHSLSSVCA